MTSEGEPGPRPGARAAAYAAALGLIAVVAAAAWGFPGGEGAVTAVDAGPVPVAAPGPDPAEFIARVEGPQSGRSDELAGLTLEEVMRRFGVPGMSVAVVHDFEVHWTKGYGVADRVTGRAVDEGTLFQAASISKPISALAAMRLAQEGRLPLDGDINAVLTSWKVPRVDGWPAVTPRALMSHTAGAHDGFGFPGYDPGAPLPTLPEILSGDARSNVGPVVFARPAFAAYKYSGGSWALMQLALSDLTRRPFDELMESLVLEPLGMSGSTYAQPLPQTLHDRAARAHGRSGERLAVPWRVYPEQAAAGLWTTPADLARAMIEVQRGVHGRGAVLDQSSARAIAAPVGVGPFGIGFAVDRIGEGWYLEHTGSNYGFQGKLQGHIRHGYGFVILTNGAQGGRVADEIGFRVAIAYDWDSTHEPLRR